MATEKKIIKVESSESAKKASRKKVLTLMMLKTL